MSAPVIVILSSIILAMALPAIGKNQKLEMIAAALGVLLISLFIGTFPFDDAISLTGISLKISGTLTFFGRSLRLDENNRFMASYMYAASSLLFFAVVGDNVRKLFSTTAVAMVTAASLALMVDPFLYSGILIQIAVLIGAFMLVRGNRHSGALLLQGISLLGMIALLAAGWTLEIVGVTTSAVELAVNTKLLLAFGIAILLGLPPFNLWLFKAAREAAPIEWLFTYAILQVSGMFMLMIYLNRYGFLREDLSLSASIQIGGAVIIIASTVWGLVQKKPERFLIFNLTADTGLTLLLISSLNNEGILLGLTSITARVISLSLSAGGLQKLDVDQQTEVKSIRLVPFIVLVVGALSLAGFPLMAGFPARWAGGQSTAEAGFLTSAAFFISTTGLSLAALRLMLKTGQFRVSGAVWFHFQSDWPLLLLLSVSLIYGISPQTFSFWQSGIMSGLNAFSG